MKNQVEHTQRPQVTGGGGRAWACSNIQGSARARRARGCWLLLPTAVPCLLFLSFPSFLSFP